MTYTYDSTYWPDEATGNSLEWVLTNGTGAYAGGSLVDGMNRHHQGYLVATLDPPTQRYVCLEKITEWVRVSGAEYDFETAGFASGRCLDGRKWLRRVEYDGTVTFVWEAAPGGGGHCESGTPAFELRKTIALVRGANRVAIGYRLTNYSADEATVVFTPKFNFREHGTPDRTDETAYQWIITGDTVSVVPDCRPDVRIDLSFSEGEFFEMREKCERDYVLSTEVELETEGLCNHFIPVEASVTVAPGDSREVSVICSLVRGDGLMGDKLLEAAVDCFVGSRTASRLIGEVKKYYADLEQRALDNLKALGRTSGSHGKAPDALTGDGGLFIKRLILDTDHFLAHRRGTNLPTVLAGLPWFTDWGRDTMISFTGLVLCTGRFEEARGILRSFARYEKNGLIPNMFPEDGAKPLYNTADASLWYVHAAWKYLEYAGRGRDVRGEAGCEAGGDAGRDDGGAARDAHDFIHNEIYPVLVRIMSGYEKGTENHIFMDQNGLIHAGADLDQVTWMDVRVGDHVVTPRHGCPVEINALWYNALCIMQELAGDHGDDEAAAHYGELKERVEKTFQRAFWNPDEGCLHDVVDDPADDGEYRMRDDSIRPNQIFAVSLPHVALNPECMRAVTDKVGEQLYVGVGLRSLSPVHPDYHGEYRGPLAKRDLSYHQGTAWGFLLGAYVDAYAKTHAGREAFGRMQAGTEGRGEHADAANAAALRRELVRLFEPVMVHQEREACIGGICEVFEGDYPHAGRGCHAQAWSTAETLRAYAENVMGGDLE